MRPLQRHLMRPQVSLRDFSVHFAERTRYVIWETVMGIGKKGNTFPAHTIKAYRGSKNMAPLFNHGTRRR